MRSKRDFRNNIGRVGRRRQHVGRRIRGKHNVLFELYRRISVVNTNDFKIRPAKLYAVGSISF